jgi:TusA-related sulfurtransferase
MTKKALKEGNAFQVIVNEHVAKENISRLLNKSGRSFQVTEENKEFKIVIEK